MRSHALRWLAELDQAQASLGAQALVTLLARHAKASRSKHSPTPVQRLEQADRDQQLSRLLDPLGYLPVKAKKVGDLATFWSQVRLSPKAALPEDKRHFHVLKHSIATHLLAATSDVRFVQDWLGHSNIQNMILYTYLTSRPCEEKARKAFLKCPASLSLEVCKPHRFLPKVSPTCPLPQR
jgi:integrase